MPTPRASLGWVLGYAALAWVTAIAFLFSPAEKEGADPGATYLHLSEYAGFKFNVDAPEYCLAARDPSRLLAPRSVRQSRPLYVLLASALGYPLQWLVEAIQPAFLAGLEAETRRHVGFYLAYVVLNFCLLLLSMLLLHSLAHRLAGASLDPAILLSLQVLFVACPITKAFFWVPHQQFFALFTPLLTVYLALEIASRKKTQVDLAAISALSGVMMLMYGSFLVVFGTVLIMAYLSDRRWHLPHLARNLLLFLAPTLAWVIFCHWWIGAYHNHEVEVYRQLVWIVDALRVSPLQLLREGSVKLPVFLATLWQPQLLCLAMASATAVALLPRSARPEARLVLGPLLLTGLVLLLFLMAVGFYRDRLTYGLAPVCLCIFIHAISRHPGWAGQPLVWVLSALAWFCYSVASYGPFD